MSWFLSLPSPDFFCRQNHGLLMITDTQRVWSCLQLFLVLPNLASVTSTKEETNITEIMAYIMKINLTPCKLTLPQLSMGRTPTWWLMLPLYSLSFTQKPRKFLVRRNVWRPPAQQPAQSRANFKSRLHCSASCTVMFRTSPRYGEPISYLSTCSRPYLFAVFWQRSPILTNRLIIRLSAAFIHYQNSAQKCRKAHLALCSNWPFDFCFAKR